MQVLHTPICLDEGLPLSRVVRVGELLFVSGMVSMDMESGKPIYGSIEEETTQIFDNIQRVLESVGSSIDQVVKATVYLTDIDDFQRMNFIYSKKFKNAPPARSTVGISLAGDYKIEVEVIACSVSEG
jgi:2-iminobutanoate/2-iminopropanoate deaminase